MKQSTTECRFAFILVALFGIATSAMAQTNPPPNPTTRLSQPIPTDYGQHRIRFITKYKDEPIDMCVVCSNSKLIAKAKGKVPVVVFLCGIGERGDNGDGEFFCGPAGWMQRVPLLDANCPVMVVSPQCPGNHLWYEPEMAEVMVHFLEVLVQDPRVDPDRVYLTGLSMGGGGTFSVAAAGAKYLAAAVPLCPPLTDPDTVVPALKNLPVWVLVGSGDDPRFRGGCQTMVDGLKKENADVRFTVIPNAGHDIWTRIYPKVEFYDWLLTHARGKKPTSEYPDSELLKIAAEPLQDDLTQKVEYDFTRFAPYWQIVNFSRDFEPGLHDTINGRKNIFTAPPLNGTTPCMMETTWKIPEGKRAKLHIIAGRAPQGDWKLIVDLNGKDSLTTTVDKTSAPEGWTDSSTDLSSFAGKEVDIQVHIQEGSKHAPAYLAKLAVEVN